MSQPSPAAVPSPPTLPLPVQLSRMIMSVWVPAAISAAATLKLPDHLGDGPRPSEDVAREAGAQPDAVRRLLRALVVLDLCTETDDGLFALTPLGSYLRSDIPDSVRNWAVLWGRETIWQGWGKLAEAVRTGETAPQLIAGLGTFDWLAQDPEGSAIFNQSMLELTRRVSRAVVAAYDFAGIRRIVDVGGGYGALLPAILEKHSGMKGLVFDLATCREGALRFFEEAGVGGRCEFVAGSFFDSVPAGADAYVVKSVLHDWDDERCLAILGCIREALSAEARLLVIEVMAPERVGNSFMDAMITGSDLNMLLMTGGRERTEAEYKRLIDRAGLRVARVVKTPSAMSVIEVRA